MSAVLVVLLALAFLVVVRGARVARSNREIRSTPGPAEVCDPETLDEALRSERAVLYKHSTRCPVSAVVINEVLKFAGAHPDWRIYVLKVIEQRRLSDTVAERLGVRHESPQAFVIRQGRCVWHGSHGGITAKQLGQYEQAS